MAKVRLNKYIASAGICSRRKADEMIEQGLVNVNGKRVSELGIISTSEINIITPAENPNPTDKAFKLFFLVTNATAPPIAVVNPASKVRENASAKLLCKFIKFDSFEFILPQRKIFRNFL